MGLRLLNGFKVLEVGERIAVAFSGKLLAELGADVVRVEPPGGSPLRRLPPYYQDVPGPERSVLHNWLCANKRSVTLNREVERGRAIFRELVRGVDVLIGASGMGLDVADLKAVSPGLTVTMISPFGADGPYADYRANDLTHFAMSSFSYYLTCPVEDPARMPPKQNPGYQVGLAAGLYAASASLWGLVAAKRKGQGVRIDVSEWEAFTYLMYEQAGLLFDGNLAPNRKRVPGAVITVVGGLMWCLPCGDGWVMISPREDHQFRRWSEVMGDPAWTNRPEFATADLRVQNAWEICERSAEWTRLHQKAEVFRAAQEKKVACFPINEMSDLPEVEPLRQRGFWTAIEHPVIRGLQYPGLPVKTDAPEVLPSRPAPLPGEHTLEICKDLGISAEESRTLWQLGVI